MRSFVFAAAVLLATANTARAEDQSGTKNHKDPEIDLFPLVGGSSDVGVGGGILGAVAHFVPGEKEYRWRIEASGIVTYNPGSGLSHFPFTDVYTLLTVPNLGRGVRLELRPSFTRETTQRYYGIGNASVRKDSLDKGSYYEYGRTHPTMEALVRLRIAHGAFIRLANYFTYDTFVVAPDSRLAQDLKSTDPEVHKLVGEAKSHAVDFFEYAFVYDTRDDETAPKSGMYHEASVRYSPGGTSFFPYRYEQLDVAARFYVSIPGDVFTFAGRVVGDVLLDNPPFYELARYEDTFALGGNKGVRGIPAQRYYGKAKVFGNLEMRANLFSFHLLGKNLRFGVATFFDAGRLWADTSSHPELDGTGFGLKYGTGGGIRLQQDKTFVVRLDLAWSPDAHPIGGYFGVGQIF
ncbi:MAG TPA: BamA/TamA family outer membrane protein [Polyangiaceae bacterium]|nr:BamA/TamA family outer membrane protein [Polyangiaceae bacterium]